MDFAGINYFAILIAAVVSFVFGGVWYGVLGKPWMAAIGKTEEQIREVSAGYPISPAFIIAIISQLVMAFVLAGVIGHLGQGNVTPMNGVISGAFVWFGFVITTLATNHGFQGQKLALTVIDGAHWLGVLIIQGAVIGLMGV